MNIAINEKFKKALRHLNEKEFQGLKDDILSTKKVIDPLIVWKGKNILIDGHHRYEIIKNNPDIDYTILEMEFEDEDAVLEWIYGHQGNRRNATREEIKYYRGQEYELKKKRITNSKGKNQYSGEVGGNYCPQPNKTSDELAEKYNVGARTIKDDSKFAQGVDLISDLDETKREEILSGKSDLKDKDIIQIAKEVKKATSGQDKTIKQLENEQKEYERKEAERKNQEQKEEEAERKAREELERERMEKLQKQLEEEKKKREELARKEAERILKEAEENKRRKKEEKIKNLEHRKKQILEETRMELEVNKPEIKIMDCIDYLNKFEDNSIDLLITDPPYSTDIENIDGFVNEWLPLALQKVKKTGRAYICIGAYPKELNTYLNYLLKQEKFIVDNPLIWTYRNTLGQTPKMKYNLNYQVILHLYSKESMQLDTSITNEMFSVQDINAPDGRLGNRFHTWQKPDELANRLIRHGSKENDLIVDCFACTGTFLISAAKQNRQAKGCEIDKGNAKIAKERGCIISGM